MHIADRVYGEFEITESILVELIASRAAQRLKGVAQFGLPDQLFYRDGFSRYEHCVGVMLLLRKSGASLEEQVAGLLHDVSHTAFSHVIDFVFDNRKDEDFQDRNHESYIRRTDIPAILEKHGMTVEQMSDYHKYTLLEQGAPTLCADRIDYTFRESSGEDVAACLPSLRTYNDTFVFDSEKAANTFADIYLAFQVRCESYEVATRYDIFSRVLKRALEMDVIVMNDFWEDDAFVLQRLESSSDDFIRRGIALLKHRDLSFMEKDVMPNVKKFRWVDPGVLVDGEVRRLSELSPAYAAQLILARENNAKGVCAGRFK
jgi:HD superfamily phosphohydrolase